MGPMLAPCTLLSGWLIVHTHSLNAEQNGEHFAEDLNSDEQKGWHSADDLTDLHGSSQHRRQQTQGEGDRLVLKHSTLILLTALQDGNAVLQSGLRKT